MPTISVVLCTYNGDKYLDQQLQSIVNQSITPDELIICDDASTDLTCEIIQKYCRQFDYIQFHRNETNLGFQKNFQQALLKTTGDYIAISDQDDVWGTEKLAILIKSFDASCLLVYSDSEFIDGNGIKTGKCMSDNKNMIEGYNPLAFIKYNCVSGHSLMIRNDLIKEALPFPEHIFYDRWLAFIAALHGKLRFVNAPLVMHREHSSNSGKIWSHKQKAIKAKLQVIESFNKYVANNQSEISAALNMLLISENSNWLGKKYLRLKFGILYGKNYYAIKKFSTFKLIYKIFQGKDYL